jgi:hypothetical protein
MAELKNILSSIGKVEGIIGHCPPNAGETGLRRSKGVYVGNRRCYLKGDLNKTYRSISGFGVVS